jgi:hypothetical protein
MTYTTDRSNYSRHTMTNTETGQTITQWDEVTVGTAKTVWDVAEILWNGDVRLHRQAKGGRVTYRAINMDRLTVVTPNLPEGAPAEAPEAAPAPAPAIVPGTVVTAPEQAFGVLPSDWEPVRWVVLSVANGEALVRGTGDHERRRDFFPVGALTVVGSTTVATEKLTEDYVRQTVIRHAREAANELDRLAQWATEMARQVRAAPVSGYTAHAGTDILNTIQTRLAKADALFSLIEKD